MNKEQKYILDTIQARDAAARQAEFFEPEVLSLPKAIAPECPHCGKKVKVQQLTLYSNLGVMGADGDLPRESVSVIANCSKCGTRIAMNSRSVRKLFTEGSTLARNLIVLVVVLAVAGVFGGRFLVGHLQEKYYLQARAELQSGDYDSAVESLTKAKKFGSADATYLLSECYENGTGVEQDSDLARELREEASEKGSKLAAYALAMDSFEEYMETGSASALQDCVDELRTNDSPEALYQLSLMTRVGTGVAQNISEADSLLKQAAEGGCVKALCDYAQKLVYQGEFEEALTLLQGYEDQQNLDVQAAEGFVYLFSGQANQGIQLISNAAEAGSSYGNLYLGDIYYNGSVAGSDHSRAYDYYLASAQAGNYEGQVGLAMCTALDSSGHRDDSLAWSLAQDCYQRGYVDSACLIGYFKQYGLGGQTADPTEALRYTTAAADNCYSPAEVLLAGIYKDDAVKCLEYLQRAYNHGARTEANNLARDYLGYSSEYFGPSTFN